MAGFGHSIVIDTSAAFAIITGEPGSDVLARILARVPRPVMSAASITELGVVIGRRFADAPADTAWRFVARAGAEVVSVDEAHARAAIDAQHRFGPGRHPARLNYGDCFTYATAHLAGVPILCTGDDFTRTDAQVLPDRRPGPPTDVG